MLDKETDARPIAYGAMLCEGFVGVMAFIAVLSLSPADYFAINVPPDRFATLGMQVSELPELSRAVGEQVAGRTGGAVSPGGRDGARLLRDPRAQGPDGLLVPLRHHVRERCSS